MARVSVKPYRFQEVDLSLANKRKTIAVFTPYLSGFYLGELASQVRAQAAARGLNLVVVMTNGFGHFNLPLAMDYIDGAYIVLNSVSAVHTQNLISKGIPVVATVEDYFPLDVEAVVSDQADGVNQLFEHLYGLGHRKIGFAGDLGIVDFRIRYEALLECYRQRDLEFDDDWLFRGDEPTLPGGRIAGNLFIDRKSECTAVICGSDMTAIGFEQVITKAGYKVPEQVAIAGIDDTYLGRERGLTSVDQGIEKMVHEAMDRLEIRIKGGEYQERTLKVPQSIRVRSSSVISESLEPHQPITDAVEVNSEEVPNLNYESAMALAKSGYESLINMSNLWGPFMHWGCLAHWANAKDSGGSSSKNQLSEELIMSHLFSEDSDDRLLGDYTKEQFPANRFPPTNIPHAEIPDHSIITLVPVAAETSQWGVLAVIDHIRPDSADEKYRMFTTYLDLVSFSMQRDALTDYMREREKNAKDLAERLEVVANTSNDGIWAWNLDTNTVDWNNRLLEMLGFTGEEAEDYRNMPFFERVHPQDQNHVRGLLKGHLEDCSEFKAKFRIQAKGGHYLWVEASGEAIREPDGHIGRFVGAVTDITERRRSEKKIEFMAYHDALTGLPNRVFLMERMSERIKERPNVPFAVMLMDLNRFKLVNDSYGHQVGDALLKYVSSSISKALRKSDVLARFGGDEFVLICDVRDEKEATVLSERILKFTNGMFKYRDIEVQVSGSLGISLYARDGVSSEDLIKKADVAMYKAKSRNQGDAMFYAEGMDVDLKDMIAMETHLRKAIEADELFLVYQAQVDSASQKILGAEVLARWDSVEYGLVPPGIFIPLAEELGFIQEIGDWVLDQSLMTLRSWKDKGMDYMKISVNVSAGQLHRYNFAEDVLRRIEQAEVEPTNLTLEITESAAINDIEHSRQQLLLLYDSGVQISLDDFGTGYSSLSLLNDLPLHWVKVDRSFIKEIYEEHRHKGMVKSITEMCHSLGYRVVAEGVETSMQLSIIEELGCDVIQGYIFSKPVTRDIIEQQFIKGSLEPIPPIDTDTLL